MSLWSRIAGLFTAKLAMPDSANLLRRQWVRSAGVVVSKETSLQVPAVFGCISRITNAIAPHPWDVFGLNGRRREYLVDDAVGYLLSKRPNPSTTAVAFRQAMLFACMAGDGNSYAEIQRDGASRPYALWPLEPERVEPHSQTDGTLFYRVFQYTGGSVDVEASRIFHLRGFASVDGLVGDSVLTRAAQSVAIALAAQTFAAQYYANGTISSGVLKHPKTLKAGSIKRLREEWLEMHSGMNNAHLPLFLEEGMEWESISVDAEKSQLQSAREFSVEDIARFWGVPLHLLGVRQSAQGYGTNISQLGLEFVRYTLASWTSALEQEADLKLFPQRAPWRETKIDLSSLTRGDGKTEAETKSILKKAGIISQNESREELGYNTAGSDGDVYMVESTMKTVEQVIDPPEPPAPAPPAQPERKPGMPAEDVARQAAAAFYAGALERYAKRLAKRREDLARNAPDKIEANLAAERERGQSAIRAECAAADRLLEKVGLPTPNGELTDLMAAVEQGEPPQLAAERLMASLEGT